jgi:hypothetical protein
MTEAVIGLVGVIVGGGIAGGATYVMARRREKQTTRAGARLLEEELRRMAGVLYGLRTGLANDDDQEVAAALEHCAAFTGAVWKEHRQWLAAVLTNEEWYPVMVAFGTLSRLRETATRLLHEPGYKSDLTAERAADIEGAIYSALRPVSPLAGHNIDDSRGRILLGPYY